MIKTTTMGGVAAALLILAAVMPLGGCGGGGAPAPKPMPVAALPPAAQPEPVPSPPAQPEPVAEPVSMRPPPASERANEYHISRLLKGGGASIVSIPHRTGTFSKRNDLSVVDDEGRRRRRANEPFTTNLMASWATERIAYRHTDGRRIRQHFPVGINFLRFGLFGIYNGEVTDPNLLWESWGEDMPHWPGLQMADASPGLHAGYLEHSAFMLARTLADYPRPYSFGYASGSNPTINATWEGGMIGTYATGVRQSDFFVTGDAQVRVSLAPEGDTVGVRLSNIIETVTGAEHGDITWRSIPLRDGQFANTSDRDHWIAGEFYGPEHQEVGGVWEHLDEKARMIGAFGGVRRRGEREGE